MNLNFWTWDWKGFWLELEDLFTVKRDSVVLDYTTDKILNPMPETPPITPQNAPTEVLPPKYDWSTPDTVRQSIRVICDEEGLTVKQKNNLSATVHCESGYKNLIHPNMVNGKVSTTDFGYFMINDWWHIGPGKDFPSTDYVMNNPEVVCRWMCRQWKAGNAKAWVCFSKGLYLNYTA